MWQVWSKLGTDKWRYSYLKLGDIFEQKTVVQLRRQRFSNILQVERSNRDINKVQKIIFLGLFGWT